MSTSSVTPPIKTVWTPEDARHAAEDAELHTLADKVIAAHQGLSGLQQLGEDDEATFHAVAIERMLLGRLETTWPDPIGDMLADWPARIVCPVVIP